jgi:hypothetical protein
VADIREPWIGLTEGINVVCPSLSRDIVANYSVQLMHHLYCNEKWMIISHIKIKFWSTTLEQPTCISVDLIVLRFYVMRENSISVGMERAALYGRSSQDVSNYNISEHSHQNVESAAEKWNVGRVFHQCDLLRWCWFCWRWPWSMELEILTSHLKKVIADGGWRMEDGGRGDHYDRNVLLSGITISTPNYP